MLEVYVHPICARGKCNLPGCVRDASRQLVTRTPGSCSRPEYNPRLLCCHVMEVLHTQFITFRRAKSGFPIPPGRCHREICGSSYLPYAVCIVPAVVLPDLHEAGAS